MADNTQINLQADSLSKIVETFTPDLVAKIKLAANAMSQACQKAYEAGRSSLHFKPGQPTTLNLVKASEIEPKKIKWLWENRIPFGKLTLFVGDPGKGKSMVATSVMAAITTGQDWYDAKNLSTGEVLVFASEDDNDDTIVPRLMAAGANLERVYFEKLSGEMRLDHDLERIRKALAENPNIRVVVIDPVSNYLGNAKMNDEQAVRQVLGPLQGLAEQSSVAIIGIMHLNKKADLQAINRVGGAMAFVGLARAVWLFCQSPDSPDEFQMLSVKQNIGKHVAGLKYRIETTNVEIEAEHIPQPYINWIGETEKSANEVLVSPVERPIKLDRATDWLKGVLSSGPVRQTEVEQAAVTEDFSKATLRRAKDEVGVRSEKRADGWYWELS